MLLKNGIVEEYRTSEIIMLKKKRYACSSDSWVNEFAAVLKINFGVCRLMYLLLLGNVLFIICVFVIA